MLVIWSQVLWWWRWVTSYVCCWDLIWFSTLRGIYTFYMLHYLGWFVLYPWCRVNQDTNMSVVCILCNILMFLCFCGRIPTELLSAPYQLGKNNWWTWTIADSCQEPAGGVNSGVLGTVKKDPADFCCKIEGVQFRYASSLSCIEMNTSWWSVFFGLTYV